MEDDLLGALRHVFGEENVIYIAEGVQMEGTIVRIFADKKFGFLKDEKGQEYFFHSSDTRGFFDQFVEDIENGQIVKVTFESVHSQKGLRAGHVTRVED